MAGRGVPPPRPPWGEGSSPARPRCPAPTHHRPASDRPNFLRCSLGSCFAPPKATKRNPSWDGVGVPGGAPGGPAAGLAGQTGVGAAYPSSTAEAAAARYHPAEPLQSDCQKKLLSAQKITVLGPIFRPCRTHTVPYEDVNSSAASRLRSFLGYRGGATHFPAIYPARQVWCVLQ